jgi:hypothetical protein
LVGYVTVTDTPAAGPGPAAAPVAHGPLVFSSGPQLELPVARAASGEAESPGELRPGPQRPRGRVPPTGRVH